MFSAHLPVSKWTVSQAATEISNQEVLSAEYSYTRSAPLSTLSCSTSGWPH